MPALVTANGAFLNSENLPAEPVALVTANGAFLRSDSLAPGSSLVTANGQFVPSETVALPDPSEIIAAAGGTLHQWCEADDPGIVIAGGGSTWPDKRAPSGLPWTKANATGLSLDAAVIDGKPVLTFDGVAGQGFMQCSLNLAAPGTTPTYFYAILIQQSWTDTDALICATSAARMHIETRVAEPNIRQGSNGTASGAHNTSLVVGTPRRLCACWSNSTADFLLVGDVNQTGLTTGNNVGTGRTLCALTSGAAGNGNFRIYATLQYSGIAPESHAAVLEALDAYFAQASKVPSVFF